MSKLVIRGGAPLCGELNIQGSKNAVLPLLAASLLTDSPTVLHNCPLLTDVSVSEKMLRLLGCKTEFKDHTLTVDPSEAEFAPIPDRLMREMRSSIIFLGAMLARFGRAVLTAPGGCELGPRPIDLHLSSLRKLGAQIHEHNGVLSCRAEAMHGADISLPIPSVGATENIMLAALRASGETHIVNAAREPEIRELGCFLNKCGAAVEGHGTSVITVRGGRELHGARHTVMADRIVAATIICAAAAAGGRVRMNNACADDMRAVVSVMSESGCRIYEEPSAVTVECDSRPKCCEKLNTMYYPGFPTDAGSPFVAVMSLADGTSVFVENIFDNRFGFVDELSRMGASVTVNGRVAVIKGATGLSGAPVRASDLRAGAALVIAGLAASGETEVTGVEYIDRGYETVENTFSALGADIRRIV